ncbi:hypothetical protein ACFQ9D_11950 [Arthrobacter koreensis]|uniref:hypothetical protein n=1 Tax=Arthrobacter koreensis TaxID=199136 RepID=UPI00363A3EEA
MSNFEIQGHQVLRHYMTDDGVQGVHQIPLAAVASRMELLGLPDPGAALDAILAETDLAPEENPYGPVYRAISRQECPEAAQAAALDTLPVVAGPDTQEVDTLKSALRSELSGPIGALQEEFRAGIAPLGPPTH